ncbi:hypothetical protein M2132_002256 [Dysgonomonas sp. PH5-45]|uniref:DUF7691 family protein n=1 Tax=unclassified Dysgonomonas TaxID=2630389 RepID=UPI00247627E4|nr:MULTISPECIES: hypothetical protein [unclassified Dysgonomonas]MDH6355906.1 hypothetical protein [Dysgonomonas sp. PH5-45]MDH6388786.1 hypothetical protein [Dysgonomonas sp. PH5-37]
MGYYIFSYAIDLKNITKAFGRKDSKLFENIISSPDFIHYQENSFNDSVSVKEALHHIVFGEKYIEKDAHMYQYALITLCAYLGMELPYKHEIKLGYETDLINGFLETDFGIITCLEEDLLSTPPQLGLPEVADWPQCGIIEQPELQNLSTMYSLANITEQQITGLWEGTNDEDEDRACAYEGIKGVKDNIDFCIANNLSLISFCH